MSEKIARVSDASSDGSASISTKSNASKSPSRVPARRTKDSQQTNATVPFSVNDISSLAKSLRASLEETPLPSQVQMLNWLAKAAGFQNYQSLKARHEKAAHDTSPTFVQVTEAPAAATSAAVELEPLSAHAAKALTQFDERGRLHKWPHKFAVQRIAMWGLWLRFDAKKRFDEKEVNSVLKAWHTYGDHVTLRRELVNMQLLARKSDCSEYWKVAQQPNAEVKVFLRALRERSA